MIREFAGKYRFLSNSYPSAIHHGGKEWSTAEHLFQAMKTTNPKDQERVRQADSPQVAEEIGQKIQVHANWSNIKERVMLKVVRLKFRDNPKLAKKLRETADQQLGEAGDLLGGALMQLRGEMPAPPVSSRGENRRCLPKHKQKKRRCLLKHSDKKKIEKEKRQHGR